MARRLVNLAGHHLTGGQNERAKVALDAAGKIFEALGDERPEERGLHHIHLANFYTARDAALAKHHAQRAVALLDTAPDGKPRVRQLRMAYAYLGHSHIRSGDLAAGETAHRRALEVARVMAGPEGLEAAISCIHLGEVQMLHSDLRAAEGSCAKA